MADQPEIRAEYFGDRPQLAQEKTGNAYHGRDHVHFGDFCCLSDFFAG